MLQKPLQTRIPVWYVPRGQFQPVLEYSTRRGTIEFVDIISWLEQRIYPGQDCSEIEWSGWWDKLIITTLLNGTNRNGIDRVSIRRNKKDASGSTTTNSLRDFYCWVRGVLVIAGEDKSAKESINEATKELREKCTGLFPLNYGRLEYILGYATSGRHIDLFAIPPPPNPPLVQLASYDTSRESDRVAVFTAFVNIARWVASIAKSNELADMVWRKDHPNTRIATTTRGDFITTLTFRQDSVTKEFCLPQEYLEEKLEVYSAIRNLPNCIRITSLRINGEDVILSHEFPTSNKECKIQMELTPLGVQRKPGTMDELRSATLDVLTFLEAFHGLGFVHRDLRWENIIRVTNGYCVIDFEFAARSGRRVYWTKEGYIPQVLRDGGVYTFDFDLYQLGLSVSVAARRLGDAVMKKFGGLLIGQHFADARSALDHLNDIAGPAKRTEGVGVDRSVITSDEERHAAITRDA
eukprot:TRINITY_DN5392_c0_g1_i1.p1 TRINITY_DN5392_c0_g1~~TRINITY_DN5392_c0_g1_i1.p1  ORF type:complete len:466 (+),score=37.15 TRINITY_DN5392_c0_g1_i1:220-1617(+)